MNDDNRTPFKPGDICKNDFVIVRMTAAFDQMTDLIFARNEMGEIVTVNIKNVCDVEQLLRVGEIVQLRQGDPGKLGTICGTHGDLSWVCWRGSEEHEIRPTRDLWRRLPDHAPPPPDLSTLSLTTNSEEHRPTP